MKASLAVSCVLALAALGAGAASVQSSAAQRCQAAPQEGPPTKPSSLAPRRHSGSRVYGVPIQPKIFSRVKRKPHKPTAPPN